MTTDKPNSVLSRRDLILNGVAIAALTALSPVMAVAIGQESTKKKKETEMIDTLEALNPIRRKALPPTPFAPSASTSPTRISPTSSAVSRRRAGPDRKLSPINRKACNSIPSRSSRATGGRITTGASARQD